MSNKERKKQITAVVQQIEERYKPEKIILYGSSITGKATVNSDVDLLIIKNTKRRFIDRISDVLLCCDYNLPLEPLVYTPREIEKNLKAGDFFIRDILKRGKVVYG